MRMLAKVAQPHVAGDVYQAGTFTVFVGDRVPASFVASEYVEDAEPGSVDNGVRREDLQALSFPNAAFDLVLTSEVFEHVADPWKAFAEVRRVLRPGGRHIFTVPEVLGAKTRSRADLPDVFHMDGPGERSLVITDFGDDLTELLRGHGFTTVVHNFPSLRVYESVAV
jgi:SAM-dependent methyltransferase